MPEFGSPFAGLKNGRKLTHEELVRAIRFMVSAEYEAIQLYQQLAESTDNKLAKEVLLDIADEEKVHAGEFLRLLHELQPDEADFYDEGAKEVEEELTKMAKQVSKTTVAKTAAKAAAKSAAKTAVEKTTAAKETIKKVAKEPLKKVSKTASKPAEKTASKEPAKK